MRSPAVRPSYFVCPGQCCDVTSHPRRPPPAAPQATEMRDINSKRYRSMTMTSAARRRPRWCRRRRQRQQALVRLHVTPYYLMAMPYYPSPFSVSMRIYICAHHRHRRLEQSALNSVRRHRHSPYTLSLPLSFGQNFPPDHRCMINIQQPLKSSLDIVAVTFPLY